MTPLPQLDGQTVIHWHCKLSDSLASTLTSGSSTETTSTLSCRQQSQAAHGPCKSCTLQRALNRKPDAPKLPTWSAALLHPGASTSAAARAQAVPLAASWWCQCGCACACLSCCRAARRSCCPLDCPVLQVCACLWAVQAEPLSTGRLLMVPWLRDCDAAAAVSDGAIVKSSGNPKQSRTARLADLDFPSCCWPVLWPASKRLGKQHHVLSARESPVVGQRPEASLATGAIWDQAVGLRSSRMLLLPHAGHCTAHLRAPSSPGACVRHSLRRQAAACRHAVTPSSAV